ncbi:MAG: glutamate 5-kinase [Candidatus Omnitrophica bacterium CG1_02_46_14]|nr:MAG: glutamate 5-kinase [Candidatus Omnitrophica bacterium CG1_02_46_14]
MRQQFTKDIKNIVVKVGTSVLTKNGQFDRPLVNALAHQLSNFLKQGIHVSVVSSGAIGGGMAILKMKDRPRTTEGLQGAAAVGQRYLMQCYEKAFSKRGFSTAQVLLTWDDLAVKKRFLNAKRTLKKIQKWGLVPVINENDTVATDEIHFGDNDRLSSLLAILVEADVQVILSDTNGLFSGDPRDPENRIRIVKKMEPSIFSHVKDKKTSFTIGGMHSKLSAIRTSVTSGIPVFLANGRDPDVLTRIFNGEDLGTLFLPNLKKGHSKKDWLKHFLKHIKRTSFRT